MSRITEHGLEAMAQAFATLRATELPVSVGTVDGKTHHGMVHDAGDGLVVLEPFSAPDDGEYDIDEIHIPLAQVTWFKASRKGGK